VKNRADRHIAQIMESQKKHQEEIDGLKSKSNEILSAISSLGKAIQSLHPSVSPSFSGVDLNQRPESETGGTNEIGYHDVEMHIQHMSSMKMEGTDQNTTVVKSNEEVDEKPAGSHQTGAHYLMTQWPWIQSIFQEVGVDKEDYVTNQEEARGQFLLYSKGFSGDKLPPIQGASPAGSTTSESTYSTYTPHLDDTIYNSSWNGHPIGQDNLGGLNPDRSLCLDSFLVKRLYDSYMKHMWVIYPIFGARELKMKVETFIKNYSPNDESQPYPSATSHPQVGTKRKYSASESDRYYQTSTGQAPKRPVDHSINNAIILMMLALGSLCEHDGFLLTEDSYLNPPHFQHTIHGSPPHIVKNSPTQSTSASSGVPSPDYEMYRAGIGSRGSSIERIPYQERSRKWNVDRIPGLAYYTLASQIHGQWFGARDIPWLQLNILAGLYWGQLGQVLKSYSYLKTAADVMCEMLNKLGEKIPRLRLDNPSQASRMYDDNTELLLTIFWSIYQLEGDIRAELDHLPHSDLAKFLEDKEGNMLAWPTRLAGPQREPGAIDLFNETLNIQDVMHLFRGQFSLRTILNSVHSSVYGQPGVMNKGENPERLWLWLLDWREGLRAWTTQWGDDDTPPMDLGVTRLRAKFYGAAYIMNRPFLHSALHCTDDELKASGDMLEDGTMNWDYGELMKQKLMDHKELTDLATASKRCILAALHSTVAFDGLLLDERKEISKRPKLTNIQGTMAASVHRIVRLGIVLT
jgi:hypothetical protein